MKKIIILFSLIFVFCLTFSLPINKVKNVFAECDESCLKGKIEEYNKKIVELQGQANTLSNQIAQFNAQISLAELKIQKTEDEIKLLSGRIDQVQGSLDDLTKAFEARTIATYKMARTDGPIYLLLTSNDMRDAISKYHYLQEVENADQNLLVRLQDAQVTYENSKKQTEDLQKQLKEQQNSLNGQKKAKTQLLASTQNDEKKYQQLLAKARSELEAIQSIVAGNGQETDAGAVSEGNRIASVISGASACSSGSHLHFEVVQAKVHKNPANYLSGKDVIWDDGPDGPFSFGGSWQWPLNDRIRITQGYGMTYYASVLHYYGGDPHTGIDMVNDNGDLTVKAVKGGTLFKGAIACGGGTLRYVRVKQDDGMDTYYLHVNY